MAAGGDVGLSVREGALPRDHGSCRQHVPGRGGGFDFIPLFPDFVASYIEKAVAAGHGQENAMAHFKVL